MQKGFDFVADDKNVTPQSRNETLLTQLKDALIANTISVSEIQELLEHEKTGFDWTELTNAQIIAADYIRKMSDDKWQVLAKIVANDVTDLPTAEDFPDWHLSAGSCCYILYQANRCFIMDCNGTWIERNLDIATSL